LLTVIRNGEIYSPEYLGKMDILIAFDRISHISPEIIPNAQFGEIKIIDASNFYIVPGFIDNHVHIIGGGGEGSFKTRTPEIKLSDIVKAGITTVISCIGTDGVTRTISNLLAKARALDEEGITAYIYTGSYRFPLATLTGRVDTDIIFIDKIIGVGELALSDHRSSQFDISELAKLAGVTRVAGMLSGKAGIINIHLGDGKRGLSFIKEIINNTEIPRSQFLPTHVNRNPRLFEESIEYAGSGGYIDLTAGLTEDFLNRGAVKCSKSLKIIIESGVNIENVTFSSDGQGSLPIFDETGNLKGFGIGSCSSLFCEVREAILKENIDISIALKVITSNPANILKLSDKGYIKEGYCADFVFLDKNDLTINTVIAKGKVFAKDGQILERGTFINE
jgi:beta-aspartyl-dipeptidase (metallo-type)